MEQSLQGFNDFSFIRDDRVVSQRKVCYLGAGRFKLMDLLIKSERENNLAYPLKRRQTLPRFELLHFTSKLDEQDQR